jgi:hypothetical protein
MALATPDTATQVYSATTNVRSPNPPGPRQVLLLLIFIKQDSQGLRELVCYPLHLPRGCMVVW